MTHTHMHPRGRIRAGWLKQTRRAQSKQNTHKSARANHQRHHQTDYGAVASFILTQRILRFKIQSF